eukprot:1212841-Amorphochlora_amoeboformis.AAC.1
MQDISEILLTFESPLMVITHSRVHQARESRDKLRRERRREIKRDLRIEAARMGNETRAKKGGTKSGFG